jgi:hypothetical protein
VATFIVTVFIFAVDRVVDSGVMGITRLLSR